MSPFRYWPPLLAAAPPGSRLDGFLLRPEGGAATPAPAAAAAIAAAVGALPPQAAALVASLGSVNGSAVRHRLWEDWEHLDVSWQSIQRLPEVVVQDFILTDSSGPEVMLMRSEDTLSWIIFFVLFVVLILFDNCVLHRKEEAISFARASAYTVFWLFCAGLFNLYIYYARGVDDAFLWGTGYLLEWMLSVDNLFVFRTIFVVFGTPNEQKHKPLFFGVVGAVVFRLLFLVIGELLVHYVWWMNYALGAFLVYTGFKVMFTEDTEDNPEESWALQKLSTVLPYVNRYAPTPRFFARLSDFTSPRPTPRLPATPRRPSKLLPRSSQNSRELKAALEPLDGQVQVPDPKLPLRATRLLMVVLCLELTDLVFAVDSVSAIVAQIPDLFLAYTACVFAMLGLRATFFVVDELVKLFSLLSFAVAAILIFIGGKLVLKSYFDVSPELTCGILVSTVATSMICSVVYDRLQPAEAPKEDAPEDATGETARA